MQVLEKESVLLKEKKKDISLENKEKILLAKNNYIKTWKAYLLNDAYKIWLSKLNF